MGYGNYSSEAHEAIAARRTHVTAQEVFKQSTCHPLMNPKGVVARECRDSADHPATVPIAFALDVTGSMGGIPRQLAMETLPTFMRVLGECGVPDPQILFCAFGDATSDSAPLQVGQFEATAELMDQWLTWSFIEGGGGHWGQESYELAMYFLAAHTELDSVTARRKRGYMFMTGDEHPYPFLSRHVVENVIGDKLDDDLSTELIVAELQRTFVPYFIIPDAERRVRVEGRWRELLGDHVLCLEDPRDTCYAAAGAVALSEGVVSDLGALEGLFKRAGVDAKCARRTLKALEGLVPPGPPAPAEFEPSELRRRFGLG